MVLGQYLFRAFAAVGDSSKIIVASFQWLARNTAAAKKFDESFLILHARIWLEISPGFKRNLSLVDGDEIVLAHAKSS